jgi:hypothetical protein
MALLVANNRSETFVCPTATASPPTAAAGDSSCKPPPPKKKWIQAYMEKATESNNSAAAASAAASSAAAVFGIHEDDDDIRADRQLPSEVIGDVVQDVIDQFQDYIDVTNQRNLHSSSSNNNAVYWRPDARRTAVLEAEQMARLLYPAHNSRKFTEGLQRLSWEQPPPPSTAFSVVVPTPVAAADKSVFISTRPGTTVAPTLAMTEHPPPAEELSKEAIGGVVQTVISQFLNGDPSDHSRLFRSSRRHKRRHRHRSSDKATAAEEAVRPDREGLSTPTKCARLAGAAVDENGVLNLSLPKAGGGGGPKVTFALEDECYDEDGGTRFQFSSSWQKQDIQTATQSVVVVPSAAASTLPGGVELRYPSSQPALVVVRPGVIAASPRAQVVPQATLLLPPPPPPASSSCVHFSGGQGDFNAASNYLNKASDTPHPASSKPFTFSSVIRPLQAAVITSSAAAAELSSPISAVANVVVPSYTAESGNVRSSVNTARTKTAGKSGVANSSSGSSKTATATRRQVIVKPGNSANEKVKASASSTAAAATLDSHNAADESTSLSSLAGSGGGGGTNRELHNRLEKNRRAHLKACFDELAAECELDARKASNLTVIKSALKTIMGLKRKEREHERELADLVQQKIRRQQLLAQLTEGMSPSTVAAATTVEEDDDDC